MSIAEFASRRREAEARPTSHPNLCLLFPESLSVICHHCSLFLKMAQKNWCAREDLNLQSFRNQILSLARLPFRHARVEE